MKKLAVIFPGLGDTADKPLLYYSRRIATAENYEIMTLTYSGFPKKVKGDRKRMEESFFIALKQSEKSLAEVDLCSYDDILFIGKSIGTIVAAKIASESPAKDKIRLILYTPLPDTFSFSFGEAIVFSGTDDPWVGKEKSPIYGICEDKGIPCTLISYANHSLESHDSFQDLKELYRIMKETERFIISGNHVRSDRNRERNSSG
ncbi:MAG: alpha/beta hydrolase [Lachnospiraceae bacterium]|nr:alpha/beta hydrolase [Lachnospiraceae bacterium]